MCHSNSDVNFVFAMNKAKYLFVTLILLLSACSRDYSTIEIINGTIKYIGLLETVYYKQDMSRTNPRNYNDTIFRYREMYFQKLKQDSIVGVKGHWYFYNEDKNLVVFEEIYDGERLIRKNNLDSSINLYDLNKHPEFRNTPFWGHNTPFGIRYSLKYTLEHLDIYKLIRMNDTSIRNIDCYQIAIHLKDHVTMPSFGTKLEDSKGNISITVYCIDKETYYPIRMKGENYSMDNPSQKIFIDQTYYDIEFDIDLSNNNQFNTSQNSFTGFIINEICP